MSALSFGTDSIDVGKVTDETADGAAKGLFYGAEHVLQVSNRHVPIEEGTLERSGHTSVDGDRLEAAVAYDTPYAPRQHEELDYVHDDGRTAKFLENALNSERDTVRALIAREIQASLGMR